MSVPSAADTAPAAAVSSQQTLQWYYQRLSWEVAGHFAEKRTASAARGYSSHKWSDTACLYQVHQS